MPTENYRKEKLKRLKDTEYASVYLSTSLEQTLSDENYEAFFLALRDVIEARQSVQKIAAKIGVTRQHLYLLLSGKGNPTLQTLNSLLKALDLTIEIIPAKAA